MARARPRAPLTLSRRQALAGGAGAVLAAGAAGLIPERAFAANGARERLRGFTGGVEPQAGRVTLDLPEVAENGNTVPLTVTVESPMTAADHCRAVMIVADGNPNPVVATFRFSPLSGRAEATTRIRLAASQNVTAVAQMSDGGYFTDTRDVIVTVGGCV